MNNYFKKMDRGSIVISLILALLLAVTPLFSIGTRYVFGDGAERDSTLLKDLDVSIDGIDEGDTIGHADEIIVKVQFNVPLLGDDEDDFVNYEDFIVLKLSDYFAFSDDTLVELELKDENGAVIGHVILSNDEDGKATATIKFDVESVFDDETNYEASGWFTATLKSNGEFDEDEEGKKTVTILDKTYEFLAPGDTITQTIEKKSTKVNLVDGTISWEITVTRTSDKPDGDENFTHESLKGFTFNDDLTDVGELVGLAVDGVSIEEVDFPSFLTGNILSYTFKDEDKSPIVVTLITEITADILNQGGVVKNTAGLQFEDIDIESKPATATIPEPDFDKDGVAGPLTTVDGAYDPDNRTITWYIYVDTLGRDFYNFSITDVLPNGLVFDSAKWQMYGGDKESYRAITEDDKKNDTLWTDEKSFDSLPLSSIYSITGGDDPFNGIGRLKIVSKLDETDDNGVTIGKETFYNQASVNWEDVNENKGSGTTNSKGVGVGYDTLTKSGAINKDDPHQIDWTINIDLKGQEPEGLIVYDLIVPDKSVTNDALKATSNWPEEDLTIGDNGVVRNNGQKLVGNVSVADLTEEQGQKANFEIIKLEDDDGMLLGWLIAITDLNQDAVNKISFTTQVVDPNVLAGNDDKQKVYNETTLHKGLKRLGNAKASVSFNNLILSKEMLKRDQVVNDHQAQDINANDRTSGLSEGFDYLHKEVIFRLNVNQHSLDFTNVETVPEGGFGKVTVVDTLPGGWEFSSFEDGADFLLYKADGSANTTDGPLGQSEVETIVAATISKTTDPQTAQFVFTNLKTPYVILVKARPSDETMTSYLEANGSKTVSNSLRLRTEKNGIDKIKSQDVTIDATVLKKMLDIDLDEGTLLWTIDYIPFELEDIGFSIQDKLSEGIDLRTDAQGNLLFLDSEGGRNVNVQELRPGDNGSYYDVVVGSDLSLALLQEKISYDIESRTLEFTFPDPEKAYRLTYVTDITQYPGLVSNEVKLIGGLVLDDEVSNNYDVEDQTGGGAIKRAAYFKLKKTDSDGIAMKDVTFTLYNTDANGDKAGPRAERITNGSGELAFYILPEGTYILVETIPDGYKETISEYEVIVSENFTVTIGGRYVLKDGESTPFTIKNYPESEEVGSLSLMKTVLGNDGDTDKEFSFRFTFMLDDEEIDDSFSYIGENGASGGTVASGEAITLKHGQKITVIGIPAGTDYLITEVEADEGGYVTTSEDHEGTIVDDETATATFINTRNVGSLHLEKKVEGNDGDSEREFEFLLELFRPDGKVDETEYGYTINDDDSGSIQGSATIMLSHGDIFFIEKLPVNTGYRVTEVDANTDGYVADEAVLEGLIETGLTSQLLFTNTRDVGHLRIEKKLAGNFVEKDRKFAFTVQLYMPGEEELDEAPYAYTINGLHAGEIVGEGSFELGGGDVFLIEKLPINTVYQVVETDANEDGYVSVGENLTGKIETDVTSQVVYTNTRNVGQLNLLKLVEGNAVDREKAFTFVVDFKLPDGSEDLSPHPYTGIGVPDGTLVSGQEIKLSHGQAITIGELLEDARYEVRELEAGEDGYLTASEREAGTIEADAIVTVVFTNTRNLGELTISKTVNGLTGDKTDTFTFEVILTDSDGKALEGKFLYEGLGVDDGVISSGDTLTLGHDQSVVIKGLPLGSSYRVVELEADQDDYITTAIGDTGKFTLEEFEQSAQFTNTRNSALESDEDGKDKDKDKDKDEIPKTGDTTNYVWLAVFIASLTLLILLKGADTYMKRRRSTR